MFHFVECYCYILDFAISNVLCIELECFKTHAAPFKQSGIDAFFEQDVSQDVAGPFDEPVRSISH